MSRRFPRRASELAAPLVDRLGDLVPPVHSRAVTEALDSFDARTPVEVLLEVAVNDARPACDLALLLAPSEIPAFLSDRAAPSLSRVAAAAGPEPLWWEFDASRPEASSGAFMRLPDVALREHLFVVARAARDEPGVLAALARLSEVTEAALDGPGGFIGFFPDRQPLPIASTIVPMAGSGSRDLAWNLADQADAAVDLSSDLSMSIMENCTSWWLAVSVDAAGFATVSLEASRVPRLSEESGEQWRASFGDHLVQLVSPQSHELLLSCSGVIQFDAIPPAAMTFGINHVKVGPDDRIKVYLWAKLLRGNGMWKGAHPQGRNRQQLSNLN